MYFGFPNANNFDNNSTLDFKQLLQNPQLTVNDLLSIKGILAEVKNSGDTFGNLFIKRHDIIKGFMDSALRPELLHVTNVEHSYIACQILASQAQTFHEHLFNQKRKEQEQDIVQTEQNQIIGQNKQLFLYLFNVLDSPPELNRTVGGYLFRIFSQLHYQNPQQIFEQFVNNHQLLTKCIKHLSNPSVGQILLRIVSSYGETILKSPKKIRITKEIFFHHFQNEYPKETLVQALQNLQIFTDQLLQKSSEFSQYILKQLISLQTLSIIEKFIQTHKQQQQILQSLSSILSVFSQFYIKQEPIISKKPKRFILADEESQNKQPRIIPSDILFELHKAAKAIFGFTQQKKHANIIKLMADISKINSNSTCFFLDESLFTTYRQILKQNPSNNILHNEIKKIIIAALKVNKKHECLKSVIEFVNKQLQTKSEFKNQLYYICSYINDENVPETCSKIWQIIKQWKEGLHKIYQTVIPAQTTNINKNRQLNDFFNDQDEIYSQDDISSQGMSPKHFYGAYQQQMPSIPIESDDDRDNNVRSKSISQQKYNQPFMKVKSVQNIKTPQQQMSKTEQVKPTHASEQSPSTQNKSSDIELSTLNVWKKVLYYSFNQLINDIDSM